MSSAASERDTGAAMISLSRRYLREYLTKIRLAVSTVSEQVVWSRPNEASNSIGNLMLHLAGNARQWIVSGVGGALDVRDRIQCEHESREAAEKSWTAFRKPSPAAFERWPSATPRRCRSSPTRWRRSPRG